MAPLKTKFNDTLSKLRDRFDRDHNRDRVNQFATSPGESKGPLAAQPRVLPEGSPSNSFAMIPSGVGPTSLNFSIPTDAPWPPPPTGGPMGTFAGRLFAPSTSPSQSSSMSVEYTSAPLSPEVEIDPPGLLRRVGSGKTEADPIDLTGPDTPEPSHDSRKSQALPAGSRFNPIDLTQAPSPSSTACQFAGHHKFFFHQGQDKSGNANLSTPVPRPAVKMEENTDYDMIGWHSKELGDNELHAEDAIFTKKWQELEDERFAWNLQAELDRDSQIEPPYGVPASFSARFTVGSALVSGEALRLKFPGGGDTALQEYGQRILGLCCARCNNAFIRDGGDIVSRVKLMIGNQGWFVCFVSLRGSP